MATAGSGQTQRLHTYANSSPETQLRFVIALQQERSVHPRAAASCAKKALKLRRNCSWPMWETAFNIFGNEAIRKAKNRGLRDPDPDPYVLLRKLFLKSVRH